MLGCHGKIYGRTNSWYKDYCFIYVYKNVLLREKKLIGILIKAQEYKHSKYYYLISYLPQINQLLIFRPSNGDLLN